jgi:hypothetical protein
MRRRHLFIAALALSFPIFATAGRPVFHDLSLAELTEASDVIAVVAQSRPFESTLKAAHGCESIQWRMSVVEVLKTDYKKLNPIIEARSNVTSVRDCVYREGWKTTGVSFAAERYATSDPNAVKQNRFIVFLRRAPHGFELTTDWAVETLQRKADLAKVLK